MAETLSALFDKGLITPDYEGSWKGTNDQQDTDSFKLYVMSRSAREEWVHSPEGTSELLGVYQCFTGVIIDGQGYIALCQGERSNTGISFSKAYPNDSMSLFYQGKIDKDEIFRGDYENFGERKVLGDFELRPFQAKLRHSLSTVRS